MSTATNDSDVWQQFLTWLRSAEPRGDVEGMLRQYRGSLLDSGGNEDEAHHAIGVIMRRLNDPEQKTVEAWGLLFDKVFSSSDPAFRITANALLAEVASGRTPGRALDVCMGEGRNTVFLAEHGWQATGIDVSAEGIARARQRAAAAGVTVTTVHASAAEFDYSRQAWDLISFLYAPVPITNRDFVARATATLAPGGVVVVESFASDREQLRRKPVDIDPRDLRAAFAGFDIQRLDDVVDRPDWADAPERMVRMVAAKPAS